MTCFVFSVSMLVAALRFYAGSCSEVCSSKLDPSADCEPRASRSLLQQEKAKLQSIGLETSRFVPPGAEPIPDKEITPEKIRYGASPKLLYRVFDNSKGSRLGVDASLLEIAFAKHKGVLQHTEAKALLKSIGKKHIDPKGMQKHVEEEILPMAQRTTIELQEEIDNAMETITNCSILMWDAEKALSHREKILGTDQQKEYQCLMNENEANHLMKDACDRVDKMVKALSETEPVKIKALPNKSAANVLPAMKTSMEFYSKARSDFEVASEKCTNLTVAAKAKHKECTVDTEVVEKFYCYMKEGRDKSCADYVKCFEDSIENFRTVKGHVEKTEGINKEHFRQMACSSWVADSHSTCELETTAHLDVSYPEEPVQSTCVPIMKFHGRGDHTKFHCEQEAVESTPEASEPVLEPEMPEARSLDASDVMNTSETLPEENASEQLPEETEAPIASFL